MFSKATFSPDLCWEKIDIYKDIYNFGDKVPLLKALYIRRTNTPLDYSPLIRCNSRGERKANESRGVGHAPSSFWPIPNDLSPRIRYNLRSSGGVLASFNVSRADEIVPPPGTWGYHQQENRQTDDTKVIKWTGEEATRRCHFADQPRRMTILSSCERVQAPIPSGTSAGVSCPTVDLLKRVMSPWQNRDCVQESRSQSNRRGASDYLFSIYTILDRFCIIFNRIWRSSLVCAGKTRIRTVSPLASWRSVVYEVRNSLTFLCWNLFNCSLKIQLYVQVWKKNFNWMSCGNLSGKYVIFGHFWTRVSLYESFGSCSWNSKLPEIEKEKRKLRKIVNSYLFFFCTPIEHVI